MGAADWDRIRQLFHDALDLAPEERAAFLAIHCENEAIRREVSELLAEAHTESNILDAPAVDGLRDALLAATDGNAAPKDTALQPGDTLQGRYRLERKLGVGGFAQVFLATDQQLYSRRVVIKALLDQPAIDPWFDKSFADEVLALASLDHPGVIGVLDTGRADDGTRFLVMQFAEGVTLRTLIEPGGMPLDRAGRLVRQIGEALAAAHEKGITHHDLKPENIMVQEISGSEDRVRLIDFGIARLRSETADVNPRSEGSRVAGSLSYMAPEQLQGRGAAASDIYSFGVVVFEMLTGLKPFDAESPAQLYRQQSAGDCRKPRDLRPELSLEVEQVLLRSLAFDPEYRPPSVRDFSEQVTAALAANPPGESDLLPAEYDVFLAHASKDGETANRIVAELERRGIRCFLPSRDVAFGNTLQDRTTAGIKNSRCFFALVTSNANISVQLARAAEIAAVGAKPLFGMRVDGAQAAGDLAFFLGKPHWIDISRDGRQADFDKAARTLQAVVPGVSRTAFTAVPLPAAAAQVAEPMFSELRNMPASLSLGTRRARLIALFSLWTLITCALSILANTAYITVMLRGPAAEQLPVRFGYLYELNGAFTYLFVVPWFVYFAIGFVLEAQIALASFASRDQIVLNRISAGEQPQTVLGIVAESHRIWITRRLSWLCLATILIIVGAEYLPPNSDYQHVMFGYVQAPGVADYPNSCPNCTLAELAARGRKIEPVGDHTAAELRDYRIVAPFYKREGGVFETAAFTLFMISVLGLQVSFVCFVLWTVVNGFFFLQLIYRAIVPSKSTMVAMLLSFHDSARMFGFEPVHRALRQLVAAVVVSASLPVLHWWTNAEKGSRQALSQDLYSLGGWAQFLISHGSFVMAMALLIYLFHIGGQAKEAAGEASQTIAALPERGTASAEQMIEVIRSQSVWKNPGYTLTYLAAPVVCLAGVMLLNRASIAYFVATVWESFLRYVLSKD